MASNRRSIHCHYLAKADPCEQPSVSGAPDCHAAIDCPYTAAPIEQANTQQICKSKLATLDVLKLSLQLSS